MNDYFFEMCDARGELSGTRVVLNSLIEALESDDPLCTKVALITAKRKLNDIDNLLNKEVV